MAEHGFERRGEVWIRPQTRFETADLRRWFPGYDHELDTREMEKDAIIAGPDVFEVEVDPVAAAAAESLRERAAQLDSALEIPVTFSWGQGVCTVPGQQVSLLSAPKGHVFVVHPELQFNDLNQPYLGEGWRVSEITTGLSVTGSSRRTPEDAVHDAFAKIGSVGHERFSQAVAAGSKTKSSDAPRVELVAPPNSDEESGVGPAPQKFAFMRYGDFMTIPEANDRLGYLRNQLKEYRNLLASNPTEIQKSVAENGIASASQAIRRLEEDIAALVSGFGLDPVTGLIKVEPPSSEEQLPAAQEKPKSDRIEDAGEKIGGARKDRFKRITLDSLREMNERERVLYIKKSAIWPTIDLQEMKDKGVPASTVLYMDEIRRQFAPDVSNPEHAEPYVRLVSAVRDAVMGCRDINQISEALDTLATDMDLIRKTDRGGRETTSLLNFYGDAVGGWKALQTVLWNRTSIYRKAASLDSYFGDEEQRYSHLMSKRRRGKSKAEEGDGRDDGDTIPVRPHLAHVRRSGLPDERDGRDISAEDLMEKFGFRAIEFGNWLPQDERQDVMNRAYDAFVTLAAVLEFPPRMMSLEGTLAIAFGSRGISRAAAHYEPGRRVINLTRLNGAGSLSHEYFHALDDWTAAQVRGLYKDGANPFQSGKIFATEMVVSEVRQRRGRRRSKVVAINDKARWTDPGLFERIKPVLDLSACLTRRRETIEEHRARIESDAAIWYGNLRSWMAYGIQKQGVSSTEADQHAAEVIARRDLQELDRLCQRLFPVGRRDESGNNGKSATDKALSALGHMERRLAGLRQRPEAYESELGVTSTDYLSEARKLDRTRSKPYWSTPCELGARAFECYVFDRIQQREGRDDYLVHGVEGERYRTGARGNPYPDGHERELIAQAMDGFIKMVRGEFVSYYNYEHVQQSAPARRMAASR